MSHAVIYLLDVEGRAFNALLGDDVRPTDETIELAVQHSESLEVECKLPCSDEWVSVDVTGMWTVFRTSIQYSCLLVPEARPDLQARVEALDRCLCELVPGTSVLRIDEILFSEWDFDWLLSRDAQRLGEFLRWLQKQDGRHWSKLQSATQSR